MPIKAAPLYAKPRPQPAALSASVIERPAEQRRASHEAYLQYFRGRTEAKPSAEQYVNLIISCLVDATPVAALGAEAARELSPQLPVLLARTVATMMLRGAMFLATGSAPPDEGDASPLSPSDAATHTCLLRAQEAALLPPEALYAVAAAALDKCAGRSASGLVFEPRLFASVALAARGEAISVANRRSPRKADETPSTAVFPPFQLPRTPKMSLLEVVRRRAGHALTGHDVFNVRVVVHVRVVRGRTLPVAVVPPLAPVMAPPKPAPAAITTPRSKAHPSLAVPVYTATKRSPAVTTSPRRVPAAPTVAVSPTRVLVNSKHK